MDLNYLKNKLIYVLTAAVSIFLIIYICFQMKLTADDEIFVNVVNEQKIRHELSLDGYLFLDDEELSSGSTGEMLFVPCIESGKFVSEDEVLGHLYYSNRQDILDDILEIDQKLLILKTSMNANEGTVNDGEYDREVKNSYMSVISSSFAGRISHAERGMNLWLTAQGKKNIKLSIVSSYKKEIARLEAERDELESVLGEGIEVRAEKSGRYFRSFDGYSRFFTDELAKSGKYEDFSSLFQNAPYIVNEPNEGIYIGSLRDSSTWYYVAKSDSITAEYLKKGGVYKGEFEDETNKSFSLIFERAEKSGADDSVYLVFRLEEMPASFKGVRYQSAKITIEEYDGLCVPMSSVRYADGKLGVYIVAGNKAEFRLIKILGSFDGKYVVKCADKFKKDTDAEFAEKDKYLARYDTLIISGKNIYEGKYIDMSGY